MRHPGDPFAEGFKMWLTHKLHRKPDVKFLGIVKGFNCNKDAIVECPVTLELWGHNVVGDKYNMERLGIAVNDRLRFGIYINKQEVPAISIRCFKVGNNEIAPSG